MAFPVFDLHCDTSYALLGKDLAQIGNLMTNDGHFDLQRAGAYPAFAQCFSCFTTPDMEQWYKKSPVTVFELELASILREIEKHKTSIALAYHTDDIKKNTDKGRVSGILTIEGPAGFGYDPALLEDLYKIGFRMTTLCWNESNPLTGSHITGEGLSDLGREYVREAQRLGMLIDVSHISDCAFWDIMDITSGPIVASHSNSRSICTHTRNITDDMFQGICSTGGVVGINFYSKFVGSNPNLDCVADHVIHFLEKDPSGKHIALGGDLDGCDALPDGFYGVQGYSAFADVLLARNISQDTVMDIFWNNAIGVFHNAIHHNKNKN